MGLDKHDDGRKRMRDIDEAVRWEAEGRKRQKAAVVAAAANGTT